jgi:hypothetical protein
MNGLLEKYNDFKRIIGYRVRYTLETGEIISFTYKKENFAHLIGLHKLKDIDILQRWSNGNKSYPLKRIYKAIEKETLTESVIKNSNHFHIIQNRYSQLSYQNLTTVSYTDVIVSFDKTIINSKLNSIYILYEQNIYGGYNHLGIGFDPIKNDTYIETFFCDNNSYIQNQITKKIIDYQLFDGNGNLIINDKF